MPLSPLASQVMHMIEKQGWAKYKLPIILAFVALGLYAFSIFWMVKSSGGAA